MKKIRTSVAGAALIAVASLSYAGLSGATANTAAKAPAEVALPVTVDDFRLPDQNMHSHELRQLGDASAVVLITQANNCPVSRNTSAAVKALQDQYSAKGVEIFMLNSTPSDTRDAIVAEAKAYGYNVPILMDTNQLVGEQLGVTRTAEAIVIDPKTWKIMYRGPIDDKVTYERQKAAADHTWAKDALDSVLAAQAGCRCASRAGRMHCRLSGAREDRRQQGDVRQEHRADVRRQVRVLPRARRHRPDALHQV